MAFQEKMLAQSRPNSTTAATLYTKPASTTSIVKSIFVCNQTGAAETFRIFFHDSGTTYDQSTALFYDVSIAANSTVELNTFIAMNTTSGSIGIRTSTSNALTFTAFGAEIT